MKKKFEHSFVFPIIETLAQAEFIAAELLKQPEQEVPSWDKDWCILFLNHLQEEKNSVERRISISKVDVTAMIKALLEKNFIALNDGYDPPTKIYRTIVSDEEYTEVFIMTSAQLRDYQENELAEKTQRARIHRDVQRKKRIK